MDSGSRTWLCSAILLGCVGAIWTTKVVSAQGGDPAVECSGTWSQYFPPPVVTDPIPLLSVPHYPRLTCTAVNCAPGCAEMQVTTAFGPGKICVCNYVGPQPFCCTVAFVNSSARPTPFGDCGGYCPEGTSCQLVDTWEYYEGGGYKISKTAHCFGSQ
jgi:hypothetical protein